MQKVVWRFLTLCICGGISVSAASKVCLLPDYQERALYSSRTNNNKDQPHYEISCSNYGMYAASQIPAGKTCAKSVTVKNLKCYGNCACRPEYQYTSSACRSAGKVASGSSCDGKYTECICDTSQYPHTSSSCAYTLSGSPCSDKYGAHYPKCVNPCEGLSDHDCGEYGCKQTYDACASKCEVCYTDNCHNRTDNETDLGCEKYWTDCPSKCELGKTCVPNSCPGYTLDKEPSEGSNYDECRPGCGNNSVKYKLYGCEEAYGFKLNSSGTDCEIAPCTEGTATTVSGCGTISNGSWTLDSLVIGSSGYEPCHMCVAACNAGYAQKETECSGFLPLGGKWTLSGSGPCKKCSVTCTNGGTFNGVRCVTSCDYNTRCGNLPTGGSEWIGDGIFNAATGCQGCKLVCKSGYTAVNNSSCQNLICAIHSSKPAGSSAILKANGKYEVTGCDTGYTQEIDNNACISCVCLNHASYCQRYPGGSYEFKNGCSVKCSSQGGTGGIQVAKCIKCLDTTGGSLTGN